MLDINLFRSDKGGDPNLVRESQRRRYADITLVDKVVELDTQWRDARNGLDGINRDFNAHNKAFGAAKKAKLDTSALEVAGQAIKERIAGGEERLRQLELARDAAMAPIGNLVHDSVPVDDDEDNNVVVKLHGKPREGDEKLWNHVDLVQLLDIVDLEKGVAVAGGRGYYLKGEGVLLNQALINFALQSGYRAGFQPIQTPFFMRQSAMAECAQLSQFDEELYKVTGEGEDKYLIATSEQPLCASFKGAWFEKADLPIKLVGYSTCFRKEVGSHGRDTLGIFRIHQFEKVEQFVVTSPHDGASWAALDEMVANAESFYQALELPYRVVNIVSGELNSAAAKKYDLEASFPASKTYRELVSCSNCTDFQSRRLEVRMRTAKAPGGEARKEHVHMLNGTLTATERTMCCLLENYQTPTGVRIPSVLQPFMMGIDFIPFRKQVDKKGKFSALPPPAAAQAVADGAAVAEKLHETHL